MEPLPTQEMLETLVVVVVVVTTHLSAKAEHLSLVWSCCHNDVIGPHPSLPPRPSCCRPDSHHPASSSSLPSGSW